MYKIISFLSTVGIILIFTLIILSFPYYDGFLGEEYNFLQHFISELGNPYKNTRYYYLNYGFMALGFLFTPLMLLIGYHSQSKWGYLIAVIGFLAVVALSLVGYLPEHKLRNHTIAAFTYFTLGSISVGLFSFHSLKNPRFNKWLFIPSLFPAILFIFFLFFPKTELHHITSDPHHYVRPDIVWLAVLEWLFFLTMSFWVLCVSLFLWRVKK